MTDAATPHSISAGTGPGVVFIHGAGGNAAVWWDQMRAFSKTHKAVAYDLAGFGRTPPPNPETYAADLTPACTAVMDAAGLKTASLVCQSLGGWTGLRMALEAPERVEKLVLSCTMAGIAHPPAIQSVQESFGKMDERGPASVALSHAFMDAEPAKAYLYQQIGAFNTAYDPSLAQVLFSPDVLVAVERLAEVKCPVLILAGEHDALWPPHALEGLVRKYPDARMHIFPGSGHSPYFEQPEEFNRVVAAFLAA